MNTRQPGETTPTQTQGPSFMGMVINLAAITAAMTASSVIGAEINSFLNEDDQFELLVSVKNIFESME